MKAQPLGKGLSQLIGEQFADGLTDAPLRSIVPNPRQPRAHFNEEALAELAESIRIHGILNPLVVRAISGGKYELIAGERRLRAAKLAGLESAPIRIVEATEQESLELALIENLQREDIGPLESARAYSQLATQFHLTQDEISVRVGKARATVANTLRLLKLPEEILTGLESSQISEGHARALLMFGTDAQKLAAFQIVIKNGLSVRETEALAAKSGQKKSAKQSPPKVASDLDHIQRTLSEAIGSPVQIDLAKSGKGRVTISFYSQSELERILERMEKIR